MASPSSALPSTMPGGIEVYRRTEIQSRTPLELVVMLYDGALRFIDDARGAIERGDIRARQTAVAKALAIVSELQSTLNMDAGGEIARSLDELYSFVTAQIMNASIKQNVAPLERATRVLANLREGWAGISAQHPGRSR